MLSLMLIAYAVYHSLLEIIYWFKLTKYLVFNMPVYNKISCVALTKLIYSPIWRK